MTAFAMQSTISPRISSSTGVGDIQLVKASTSRCNLPYGISNFKQLASICVIYSHLGNILTVLPVELIQPRRLARVGIDALLLVGVAIIEVKDHVVFALATAIFVSRFASIPFSRWRRSFTVYCTVGKNDAENLIWALVPFPLSFLRSTGSGSTSESSKGPNARKSSPNVTSGLSVACPSVLPLTLLASGWFFSSFSLFCLRFLDFRSLDEVGGTLSDVGCGELIFGECRRRRFARLILVCLFLGLFPNHINLRLGMEIYSLSHIALKSASYYFCE